MQPKEFRERVARINECARMAIEACQSDTQVPQELRERVVQLDRQTNEAEQLIEKTQDESRLRQCIDELEEISEEAKRACQRADGISERTRDVVIEVHDEISELKHKLH